MADNKYKTPNFEAGGAKVPGTKVAPATPAKNPNFGGGGKVGGATGKAPNVKVMNPTAG